MHIKKLLNIDCFVWYEIFLRLTVVFDLV